MASNSDKCLISKEVTIEILSRLRVKSLIRFGCVCKYWNSLVRNSSFINKHLHHPNNISGLLVQHHNYNIEKYVFALFSDETLSSVPCSYHDINDLQMPSIPLAVIGPIDGIFCLFTGWDPHRMAMWNPATKEFRTLTLPDFKVQPHFNPFYHNFGCGLDPITKDYKVIWMHYNWDDEKEYPYNPRIVAVYTLGTDSWRLFDFEMTECLSIHNSLCNTYMNGFYYWLADSNFGIYTLLSFDIRTENFKEIPVPPDISKSLWGDIAMYNGRIAMILYDPSYGVVEKYIYTWVMEEDDYWTKHLAIGPLLEIHRPLGIWKNGDLFLESDTAHLLLHDHITEEIKTLGPRGQQRCLEIYLYKESLVSVKGGNECKEVDNMPYLGRVQEFFKLDEEYEISEEES
ncbi:putative F-box protein At1g32420 [Cornus florida]|uniref:putative F-box protein At1g32420 n=1 Tax=Cornus florida TaxID=4283 RepID=UPI00289A1854|nr:putative F-box protein At1g32420 [Cornus florida]